MSVSLNVDVLQHIYTMFDGDVIALCSSVCVCKKWNEAGKNPHVWRRITVPAALKMTAEAFFDLCCRSRSPDDGSPQSGIVNIERLDVTGCVEFSSIIDDVLQGNSALTHLSVAYMEMSAMYLAASLEGTSLVELRVRGIPAFEEDEADELPEWRHHVIDSLLKHVVINDVDIALVTAASYVLASDDCQRTIELAELARRRSRRKPEVAYFTVRDSESGEILHYAKDPRLYGLEDGNAPLTKAIVPLQSVGLDVSTVCRHEDCNKLCGGAAARAFNEAQCPRCAGFICSECVPEVRGCNIHGLLLCSGCMVVNDGLWCSQACYSKR